MIKLQYITNLQQIVNKQLHRFAKKFKDGQIIKDDEKIVPSKPYIHPYNYNFEQHKEYTQSVDKQLKIRQKEEIDLLEGASLPRRQRRKYDRPKHDLDITNYSAWRTFDRVIIKRGEGITPVPIQIPATPKDVRKVFGIGIPAWRNPGLATYEYDFEDVNYDIFHLYDYKATQNFHGPNKDDYNYEDQSNIHPFKRIKKQPTEEEFWQSDTVFNFRINCNVYADFRKFKVWFLKQIEDRKNQVSFHDVSIQKNYKFETYDEYDKDYSIESIPTVMEIDKSYWLQKGETLDPELQKTNPFYQKFVPSKILGEEHRVQRKK